MALLVRVVRQTVRKAGVSLRDIDLAEQVFVHKVGIALLVARRHTVVFVQVDGVGIPEGDFPLVIFADQLLIQAGGGRAGGKAEERIGFHQKLRREVPRGDLTHVVIVVCRNDFHIVPSL